jgi:hypothetical protein
MVRPSRALRRDSADSSQAPSRDDSTHSSSESGVAGNTSEENYVDVDFGSCGDPLGRSLSARATTRSQLTRTSFVTRVAVSASGVRRGSNPWVISSRMR